MIINKICLTIITILLFLPTIVQAGSCPSIVGAQIDSKISNMDAGKYEVLIAAAIMLKDQGILEHQSGSHKASEDLLNGALRLLEI